MNCRASERLLCRCRHISGEAGAPPLVHVTSLVSYRGSTNRVGLGLDHLARIASRIQFLNTTGFYLVPLSHHPTNPGVSAEPKGAAAYPTRQSFSHISCMRRPQAWEARREENGRQCRGVAGEELVRHGSEDQIYAGRTSFMSFCEVYTEVSLHNITEAFLDQQRNSQTKQASRPFLLRLCL